MSDFDRRMSQQLRAGAERILLPPGDAEKVMARGRRRHRRFQTAVAGVAFVAGAGLVTGLLATQTHFVPHTIVELVPATTTGQSGARPAQLVWRVVPATSGLGAVTELSSGAGNLYAVSTAPGVSAIPNVPAALYRSTDGATWTELRGASNQPASLAAISAGANTLYTVGTGPLDASIGGPQTVRVSSSTDQGVTFKGVDLPLEFTARAGSLKVDAIIPQVAAGSSGVVVAVASDLTFDLAKAEPSVPSTAAWAATPQGVEVLGSERTDACGAGQSLVPPKATANGAAQAALRKSTSAELQNSGITLAPSLSAASGQVSSVSCYGSTGLGAPLRSIAIQTAYPVVGTYTWGQLGVSAQAAEALQQEPLLFYSADGSRFEQAALPASLQGSGMYLTSGSNGYALATDSGVIESTDGRDWSAPIALPATDTGNLGAGFVGGRLVVIAGYGKASAAYTLTGSTWTTAPIPDGVMSLSFGPFGVAAVGIPESPGSPSGAWNVFFSRDGTDWSSQSLNTLSRGQVDWAVPVVGASNVVVTVTRPPASAVPATAAAQVALIGTPTD